MFCDRSDFARFESLESRTLFASQLTTAEWISYGPGPIAHGHTPGLEAVSGRITAVAVDSKFSNVMYIAAAGGGVWKTGDAGKNWKPLTDNQATLFMGAIAVAPSNSKVIYAGTGESDGSGDSGYGRGVLLESVRGMKSGRITWPVEPSTPLR